MAKPMMATFCRSRYWAVGRVVQVIVIGEVAIMKGLIDVYSV
jgi:hypothetical protein